MVKRSCLCVALMLALASAPPVLAQTTARHAVEVQAQDLGPALKLLAQQMKIQIVYSADLVQGKQAPALNGSLTPTEALNYLLKGSGLKYEFLDAQTVTLSRTGNGKSSVPATTPTSQKTQPTTYDFDIPSQELGAALKKFTKISGQEVVFDRALIRGKVSVLLQGTYTADQGIEVLLEQTGLTVRRDSQGVLLVEEASQLAGAPSTRENITTLDEIVVTGTNIRGVQNETLPLIQFDRKDLDNTGYSSTQDFVRSIPQNFAGSGATEEGRFGNGNAPFIGLNSTSATAIDLRGLGPSSTLVLLNGRRMAPAAVGSFIDVSLIPFSAIDRVDVLTDGSSAIYGADAVGGVVNFVLRSAYEEAETRVRYGTVTDGSREEQLLSQTIGRSWDSGNALLAMQYQHQTPLRAEERRDAVGNLRLPSDLMPETDSYSGIAHLQQDVSERLGVFAQAVLSKREYDRVASPGFLFGPVANAFGASSLNSFTVGTTYRPTDDWQIELSGNYAKQKDDSATVDLDASGARVLSQDGHSKFSSGGIDLVASGPLFRTLAGDASIAIGGSARTEELHLQTIFNFGAGPSAAAPITHDRDVWAAFAELYIPIVGEKNALTFARKIDLSLAVRHDDYSDFGGTTNPRIGILWEPVESLNLRASYGTSFRTPTAIEINSASLRQVTIGPGRLPDGGTTPVFITFFNELGPESADVFSVGATFEPKFAPALSFGINYYDIDYEDRIAFPPSVLSAPLQPNIYAPIITTLADDAAALAFLNAQIAQGATVNDFVGTGAVGVRYALNGGVQNLGRVHQSGFDILTQYSYAAQSGTFNVGVNANIISKIETAFSSTAPSIDVVDNYGSPVDFRGRVNLGWDADRWGLSAALNYVDDYRNPGRVPEKVSSWTAIDLVGRLELSLLSDSAWTRDAAVTLSVQNIFDRDPPKIAINSSNTGIGYDQANATALGRFVAIELRKTW